MAFSIDLASFQTTIRWWRHSAAKTAMYLVIAHQQLYHQHRCKTQDKTNVTRRTSASPIEYWRPRLMKQRQVVWQLRVELPLTGVHCHDNIHRRTICVFPDLPNANCLIGDHHLMIFIEPAKQTRLVKRFLCINSWHASRSKQRMDTAWDKIGLWNQQKSTKHTCSYEG